MTKDKPLVFKGYIQIKGSSTPDVFWDWLFDEALKNYKQSAKMKPQKQ